MAYKGHELGARQAAAVAGQCVWNYRSRARCNHKPLLYPCELAVQYLHKHI